MRTLQNLSTLGSGCATEWSNYFYFKLVDGSVRRFSAFKAAPDTSSIHTVHEVRMQLLFNITVYKTNEL